MRRVKEAVLGGKKVTWYMRRGKKTVQALRKTVNWLTWGVKKTLLVN